MKSEIESALYARVLKSILLSSDIEAREERGELLRTVDPLAQSSLLGKYEEFFSREMRERAEKMTYVYCLFFCFENAVRDLVSQRLEERKGPNWWDFVPESVRNRVEQKKKDIEENKWHRGTVEANIDHTLFGDLSSMIVKEWKEFEDLFPSQPWVNQRLNELERSRNIIAHGNLLPDSEVERIEQYLDDWLRQVP